MLILLASSSGSVPIVRYDSHTRTATDVYDFCIYLFLIMFIAVAATFITFCMLKFYKQKRKGTILSCLGRAPT